DSAPGPLGLGGFLQAPAQVATREVALELVDLALEVGQILEALVDRSEAQVRDRVELAQALEHRHADLLARDLGPAVAQGFGELDDDRVHGVGLEPSARGARDARGELGVLERLDTPRALAHRERHVERALERRESTAAREALPPPAY